MWVLGWVLLWPRAVRMLFWSEWGWGHGLKEASKSSSLGQALRYDMMLGRYKKELNTVELEDKERDLRVSGLSLHNNSYWFPVQNGTLLTGHVTFLDVNPTAPLPHMCPSHWSSRTWASNWQEVTLHFFISLELWLELDILPSLGLSVLALDSGSASQPNIFSAVTPNSTPFTF